MKKYVMSNGPWPRLQRFWDTRAACNFIGGGTGSGLLLVAAVSAATGGPWLPAAVIGLVCIAFGLMMVFLEIGRPWRSINVFFHPQTSWMTREGVVALPLFGLGAAVLASTWAFEGRGAATALILTAVTAAGFLFCQANILRAARGVPVWRQAALRPFMLATGVAEGAGLFLVIAAFTGVPGWSVAVALLTVAARAAAWAGYRAALRREGAPDASLRVLNRLAPRFLVAGHAVPAILLITALALPEPAIAAVLAGLLMTGAGWHAKLMLVTRAAATRGFAVPHTPVRGRGVSRDAATRPGWSN